VAYVDNEMVDSSSSKAATDNLDSEVNGNGDSAPSAAQEVETASKEADAPASDNPRPASSAAVALPPVKPAKAEAESARRIPLIAAMFGIDPRGLAAFRVGLGICILLSIFCRRDDLLAMYSDEGLTSRVLTLTLSNVPEWWSVYHLGGGLVFTQFLFAVTTVVAVMLMLGYRTTLMTILSWVMIVSLQNRNPMIIDGQDIVLRVLLFFALFLPLGDYYSFDRVISTQPKKDPRKVYCSFSSFAVLFQVALIYFLTALLKDDPAWRTTGEAGMYALNVDFVTLHPGVWLTQFPQFLRIMTFATVFWEGYGPFLLFVPNPLVRTFGIMGFFGLHLFFLTCLKIGFFPIFNWISFIPFVPPAVWDRITVLLNKSSRYHSAKAHLALAARQIEHYLPSQRPLIPYEFKQPLVSVVRNVLAVSFIVLVTWWNANTVWKDIVVPPSLYRVAMFTRLDQNWFMFAHFIPQLNGYYVMPGVLKNGQVVDIWRGGKPVDWARPLEISSDYANHMWRIYMIALFNDGYKAYRPDFAAYMCREWNKTHIPEEHLKSFQMFYMYEGPLPEINLKDRVAQKVTVWEYTCPEQ
jgi:hypothetical protein